MANGTRIQALFHVPFEGLGSINAWLRQHGCSVAQTAVYQGEALPGVEDFDWLIILGGPMSVHDESRYAWMAEEKALVRQALDQGKGLIGICLGAQLVAETLGAEVYSCETEIGWGLVSGTPESQDHPLNDLLDGVSVLHWHNEAFTLPEGAQRLAASEGTPNQAFQYGDRVLGLQFHLETTREDAERMCRESHPGTGAGARVQAPEAILADPHRFPMANTLMREVLAFMLEPAEADLAAH